MKSNLTEKEMVSLRLPDGSVKKFPKPVTGMEVAKEIGPCLAKAALAIRVNKKRLYTLVSNSLY